MGKRTKDKMIICQECKHSLYNPSVEFGASGYRCKHDKSNICPITGNIVRLKCTDLNSDGKCKYFELKRYLEKPPTFEYVNMPRPDSVWKKINKLIKAYYKHLRKKEI